MQKTPPDVDFESGRSSTISILKQPEVAITSGISNMTTLSIDSFQHGEHKLPILLIYYRMVSSMVSPTLQMNLLSITDLVG